MLLFGRKSKEIKTGHIKLVTCPYCYQETSMTYTVFGKYFHLYFVPMFPYKKVTTAECDSCHTTFEWKHLPETIYRKILKDKETYPAKNPVWMFSGLFALAGLSALAYYQSGNTWEKETGYISQPKAGDIYYYDLDSAGLYTSLRVDKVINDRIHYTANDTTVYGPTKVVTIDKPERYTSKKAVFTKQRLKQLYDNNTIFIINRK